MYKKLNMSLGLLTSVKLKQHYDVNEICTANC